jgi:hypothetical protein
MGLKMVLIYRVTFQLFNVQENEEGLELNGKPQLLVYADYINIWDENIKCHEEKLKLW